MKMAVESMEKADGLLMKEIILLCPPIAILVRGE
jgi:hypothetical protein